MKTSPADIANRDLQREQGVGDMRGSMMDPTTPHIPVLVAKSASQALQASGDM